MRRVLALSCALLLSGCSITRIVEPDFEHLSKEAQRGDTARVLKRDGEYLVLRVVRVEDEALVGTTGRRRRGTLVEHRVEYRDIQDLRVVGRGIRRFTVPERIGIATAATLVFLTVFVLLF